MIEASEACKHCGGMVDADGVSLHLAEDEMESPEAKPTPPERPRRDFAKAVEARKED